MHHDMSWKPSFHAGGGAPGPGARTPARERIGGEKDEKEDAEGTNRCHPVALPNRNAEAKDDPLMKLLEEREKHKRRMKQQSEPGTRARSLDFSSHWEKA